ncbi:hypothetical protein MC7420_4824 [Coleofasciculus chthonoplastes PCC 7420]|uniref:PEP-CTERM exosortase interaction domain protein n=1 Tax=Coleofasciculus chthonoplastes PCC 7420 TaxID=118168 RepID=B4VP48_9CYAN|nr:hypothetical protein [Coleofasciculus chthonoplastes]EDX76568.1 hypothetical protein MC7420_4824 [Coleofasciculus chthonoplastes PCC 7420]
MKQELRLAQSVLSFAAPLVTSSVLLVSPSLAATFASAEANVFLENFSQSPDYSTVSAKTNTVTMTPVSSVLDADEGENASSASTGDSVTAIAQADSLFFTNPPAFATNTTVSNAFGDQENFFGFAKSEASVIGGFLLNPAPNSTESFSFDFTAFFNLATSGEKSTAAVDISLVVLGGTDPNPANQTVFDFFSVSGELNSLGEDDLFSVDASDNFTLNTFLPSGDFGVDIEEESADLLAMGSYQRQFDRPTYLTFVETKETKATVQAPEPASTLALVIFGGWLGLGGRSISMGCRSRRRIL